MLLLVSLNLLAQESVFRPNMLLNQFNGFKNLQMNHSVSFTSGVSSSSNSFYMSTYTNHLKFTFGPNLDMNVNLNFVNYGTATYQKGLSFSNNSNANLLVPELELKYKPTENTEIRFMFRTVQPFTDTSDDFLRW